VRRWLTSLVLTGLVVTALTGCGKPSGVDGDLLDDWPVPGEPTVFVPESDTCHPKFHEIGYLAAYQPVACDQAHMTETLHVGTFTGKHADRTTPPSAGSPAIRAAFSECDKKVRDALGGDWRIARLAMTVVLPSSFGWDGGARWFRCDVSEVESLDDRDLVDRSGSLKGALTSASDLNYGCFVPQLGRDDELEAMKSVPCKEKHRSEFAGIWTAPDVSYESFTKDSEATHRGCLGVIASYTNVPNDADIRYRVGSIYYYPRKEEWETGNRGVQCFLWLSNREVSKSLKGAGTAGLPIN
jgi:hypothetical protein